MDNNQPITNIFSFHSQVKGMHVFSLKKVNSQGALVCRLLTIFTCFCFDPLHLRVTKIIVDLNKVARKLAETRSPVFI